MPSNPSNTMAALLTPTAPGAIAVIAMNGPHAARILSCILKQPRHDAPPDLPNAVPVLCRVTDERGVIDDVIVAMFSEGGSLHAELCLHGGVRVMQRVLLLLEKLGVTIVDAADFIRQCSNTDPIQQDVDEALLRARSRKLARWLLHQRAVLPGFLAAWGSHPPLVRADYARRTHVGIRMVRGFHVALVGPPNSGKSTLANRLIGDERILTSDRPGTTRDWVSETAILDGWPVTLTDTAGVRETLCDIEQLAIRRGTQQAHAADLVLLVLDGTRPQSELTDAHRRAVMTLRPGQKCHVVVNKCDLFNTNDAITEAVKVSARTGQSLDRLEQSIIESLGVNTLGADLPSGFLVSHLP